MRNGSQLFETIRHGLERFNCSKLNVIVIHLHVRARNTEGLVLWRHAWGMADRLSLHQLAHERHLEMVGNCNGRWHILWWLTSWKGDHANERLVAHCHFIPLLIMGVTALAVRCVPLQPATISSAHLSPHLVAPTGQQQQHGRYIQALMLKH